MSELAPIVLFTYNRPKHTVETLKYLQRANLASKSRLIVFCDGPKQNCNEEELIAINKVWEIVKKINWTSEIEIHKAKVNKGLADSVINGVSAVIEKYERVIVLEDDIIVGKHFLEYMNTALEKYKNEKKVLGLSGYNWPIKKFKKNNEALFFPAFSSWGWGAWKRSWKLMNNAPEGYEELSTNKAMRKAFNLGGGFDFATLLEKQMKQSDTVSSWAILFNWHIFIKKGLVLYPDKSLLINVGWDGSGRHCSNEDPYEDKNWDINYEIKKFPKNITFNKKHFKNFKQYLIDIHNPSIILRVINKFKRTLKIPVS